MDIGTQVVVNLFSTGLLLALLGFFLRKYMKDNEDRHKTHEAKDDHMHNNYTVKFEKVYRKIDESDERMHEKIDETKDQLLTEIKEVNRDKVEFRMKQIEKMASIENEVKNLARSIDRNNNRPH